MPSDEANGLAPCHTCSRVREHGRHFIEIDEHVAVVALLRCSRRGHPARTKLSQSRGTGEPAPTTSSRDFPHVKRLGIPHHVESGEPFTADRNLRMDVVIRRGGLRDAPNSEYREKSILLDVTHVDSQAEVHLRGSIADHDGSAASSSEACNRQHYASPGYACALRRKEQQTCHYSGGKLWAVRGRG